MPTYDFRCRQCGELIEVTMSMADFDRARAQGMRCSRCGGDNVQLEIAGFEVKTERKS